MLDKRFIRWYNNIVIKKRGVKMSETKELILNALGIIARIYPEQRMGQIIYNYICRYCPNGDPFYIEDKKLLQILEMILKENFIQERTLQKRILLPHA